MKKLLLSLSLCLLLCGCGNKLVCTAEPDEMKSKLTFTVKGDKVTSLKEEYTFDSKEFAKALCGLAKLGKSAEDIDDVKVKCSSKKVTVSSKNVEDYYDTDDKDEIREALEERGFKCN